MRLGRGATRGIAFRKQSLPDSGFQSNGSAHQMMWLRRAEARIRADGSRADETVDVEATSSCAWATLSSPPKKKPELSRVVRRQIKQLRLTLVRSHRRHA